MSKHRNYDEYYKPKREDKRDHDISSSPKAEEVQEPKETVEDIQEEKEEAAEPVEEVKAEEPVEDAAIFFEVIGADRVNFRLTPSKESKVIAVLSKGEKVERINNPSPTGWRRVKYKEFEGFMMSQFLKEIK